MGIPPRTARLRKTAGRVTMADVARLAGVSTITVSRLLRDPRGVSDDKAARIRMVIDQLGYVPNLMAGGLAAAKSRIVGVVVPSVRNAFFAATVDALAETLEPRGLAVLDSSTDYDFAREDKLVAAMLAWNPAALVLTGFTHSARTRDLLAGYDLPIFEMWDAGVPPIDMAVGFDHHQVGRVMARHLILHGRRRIAVVGAIMRKDTRAGARCFGMRDELAEAGLTPAAWHDLPRPSSVGDGARAMAAMLETGTPIDAVAFSNDVLALGAMFELQRRGIKIPADIALIGFGDMDFTAHTLPALTTIRPPREAIGRQIGWMILERLDGRKAEPRIVDLQFELIARASV